jgi:hypothetical protein
MIPELILRSSQWVLARASGTPKVIITAFLLLALGIQAALKGRCYGEEEEKAARVDFKRAP